MKCSTCFHNLSLEYTKIRILKDNTNKSYFVNIRNCKWKKLLFRKLYCISIISIMKPLIGFSMFKMDARSSGVKNWRSNWADQKCNYFQIFSEIISSQVGTCTKF
jgi:hypothetical protein